MKDIVLSKRTIQTLENFAKINPDLLFKEGNLQETINEASDIWIKAQIVEDVPCSFAIADISKFLGIVSLFKEPKITIHSGYLKILGKDEKHFDYTLASPEVVISPPNEKLTFPPTIASFDLSKEDLRMAIKKCSSRQTSSIQFLLFVAGSCIFKKGLIQKIRRGIGSSAIRN